MEQFPIQTVDPFEAFPILEELPQPPKQLFVRGTLENIKDKKLVAVVGSRRCTSYGKAVCRMLIEGLRGYPVVIISGLALGIDSVAHQAALDVGLTTISFPGSGLDWKTIYPAQHRGLAETILGAGGALLSEYPAETRGAIWTFPRRNRIVAGIADMVVIVEAEEKSGALITARLGTEYNKIVAVVPGPITSPSSKGVNQFLRLGAVPITESADILHELGLKYKTFVPDDSTILNDLEQSLLACLVEPKSRDQLIQELALDPATVTITLSTLEIKGIITESLGMIRRVG